MHAFRPVTKARRFLSAMEGRRYPTFDLTGEQARIETICTALGQLQKLISATLTQEYRGLLNHGSLQVTIDPWQHKPAPAANHWLAALDVANPAQAAYLGFDSRDLFGASEVFFGGDPNYLKDSVLQRALSESEQRLALRLFNALLKTLSPALELNLENWQSRWLQLPPDGPGLWTELKVSTADWTLRFHCGLPATLGGQQPERRTVDEKQMARLQQNMLGAKIRLRVQLAQLDLNLGELLKLRKGDILGLDLQEMAAAKAGEVTCLKGQVCEQGDRLALRVVNGVGEIL